MYSAAGAELVLDSDCGEVHARHAILGGSL